MTWEILNTLFRLSLSVLLLWGVLRHPRDFNSFERHGQALMAATVLLTITVLWDRQHSPFDGWATAIFSFGALMYFGGRAYRIRDHARRNRAMIAQGRAR